MTPKQLSQMQQEFPELFLAWKLIERDRERHVAQKNGDLVERARQIQLNIEHHYLKILELARLRVVIDNFLNPKKE